MKCLTLVRHAKSSWKDPTLADRDRPLNRRGKRDAPKMGRRLAQRQSAPDLIISSPAVRALATAKAIAKEIGYPPAEIVVDDRLYHASVLAWMYVIRELDDDLDHVICFGHNPGMTELVNYLSPLSLYNLPTCGVVELTYDTAAWAEIGRIGPVRVYYDDPKKGAQDEGWLERPLAADR